MGTAPASYGPQSVTEHSEARRIKDGIFTQHK